MSVPRHRMLVAVSTAGLVGATLLGGLPLAAASAAALPSASSATPTVVNVTTDDIHHADDESPGHGWYRLIYNQAGAGSLARVVPDPSEPGHHDGSLHLATPDEGDRLDIRYAVDLGDYGDEIPTVEMPTLSDLADARLAVKALSGQTPGFIVEYDCVRQRDAYPTGDFALRFVGPIPSDGSWHDVELGSEAPVWSQDGSPKTRQQLIDSCPENVIRNYGFVMETAGSDSYVDDISVGPLTTNFWVPPLLRLAGADRGATACALAGHYFAGLNDVPPDASQDHPNPSRVHRVAQTVVLVNGSRYADTLAAGPLAALVDGPLLLNHGSTLDTECDTWTLGKGDTAYLVGGRAVLSTQLEAVLKDRGMDVVRLVGDDRYETAVKVAQAIDRLRPTGTPQQVFLASGTDFADALSAGAPAGVVNGAVLLTAGRQMAPATSAYLGQHPQATVYAIGGPAASAVELPADHELVGQDRYATATVAADRFFPEPDSAAFASGAGFADALSAAAYGGNQGLPVILTAPNAVPTVTSGWVQAHRATLGGSVLLGGAAAVDDAAFDYLYDALAPIG